MPDAPDPRAGRVGNFSGVWGGSRAERRGTGSLGIRRVPSQRGSWLGVAGGLLFTVSLGGCGLAFRSPSVAVAGMELISLGLQGGRVQLYLDVTNRGRRSLQVEGVHFRVEVQGREGESGWAVLSEGSHLEKVTLPGEATVRIGVPVPFRYDALGVAFSTLLARGEVPYRISGSARVRGAGVSLSIPLRGQGVLKP